MASRLPDNPSLAKLRQQARALQRAVRAGNPAAAAQVRAHHPAPDAALADTAGFALHQAQLTVARGAGFSGWPALVHYLQVAEGLSRDPHRLADRELSPADRFCALACLRYDGQDAPERWASAAALWPQLQEPHLWAAAAAGDVDLVRAALAADPAAANAVGGPFGWPPLLYLTYSRVPVTDGIADPEAERRVLATAAALLDAGADPNAGYLWRGLASPFTALTGVFGEGEQGPRRQPRHPFAPALARLLLRAGAEPADSQVLYNRMLRPGNEHLTLLFEFGLGRGDGGPWRRRLGAAALSWDELLDQQLTWAADHGFAERLALLAEHGADLDAELGRGGSARSRLAAYQAAQAALPADPNAIIDGATRLHRAAWDGDLAQLARLLAAGADPTIRDHEHGGTPRDWATHAGQEEAAAMLAAARPAGPSQPAVSDSD